MHTIEADGRPIMTIAAERDELEFGDLLDKEGALFSDMTLLAGVPDEASLTYREAFDEERDAWTKAAHGAVRDGDYRDLEAARDDSFGVWLVPLSEPDDDEEEDV